jgi:hypothetical protein
MLYAVIKALLSGIVIAAASEVAQRSPAIGAIILSLPLISILAFIWLWRDTSTLDQPIVLDSQTFLSFELFYGVCVPREVSHA